MSEIRDIIKVELKKAGKAYIKELKFQLGAQQHRAFDNLYKSFRIEISDTGGSFSLDIVSDSSYLWTVNDGAANGVEVDEDIILAWAKQKGLVDGMNQAQALRYAINIARQLGQGYYTPGGKLIADGNRYGFVTLAMQEAERMGVIDDIEKSIGKQIESVMGWDKPEAVLQLNVS